MSRHNDDKTTSLTRYPWDEPDGRVILYSLYKFAAACNLYTFDLNYLYDDTIERAGIAPHEIFGISREVLTNTLRGVASSHPEYISFSTSLGVDNITLKPDVTADDCLNLF